MKSTWAAPAYRTLPSVIRVSRVDSSYPVVFGSSTIGPLGFWKVRSNVKSGRENTSAGSVCTSVLRMISSANELPSSWTSMFRPAVRDR